MVSKLLRSLRVVGIYPDRSAAVDRSRPVRGQPGHRSQVHVIIMVSSQIWAMIELLTNLRVRFTLPTVMRNPRRTH